MVVKIPFSTALYTRIYKTTTIEVVEKCLCDRRDMKFCFFFLYEFSFLCFRLKRKLLKQLFPGDKLWEKHSKHYLHLKILFVTFCLIYIYDVCLRIWIKYINAYFCGVK